MKKTDLRSQAVMHVDKGEEIAGMWATPQLPQIGIYKLIVKKRLDGKFEWVHFQHRADGTRKVLFRGAVESKDRIAVVLDAANKSLRNVYGIMMSPADSEMTTLDGRKAGSSMH